MAFSISIIIPVYNRPEELKELLSSLVQQTNKSFEVIVIDDGSTEKSNKVSELFEDRLSIRYFFQKNQGPGQARNYGCDNALGDLFIFFDSDCIIPEDYIENLRRRIGTFDAFGGPDKEHPHFTAIQKAISYSMTSIFTTGGIRGKARSAAKFHPRSFNMGIHKAVYDRTGGFSNLRFGEDIDLSIRIFESGFRSILIPECFVFHKRRTDFKKFFKQVYNSGLARINLYKRHRRSLKLVYFFPSAFLIYQVLSIPHAIYHDQWWVTWPTLLYLTLILIDAIVKSRSLVVGILSVYASIVQLFGYGLGFISGFMNRIVLKRGEFHAFDKTFYD